MPIVLASDDADRRGRIADPIVRSGAPLVAVSDWAGLVRELTLPGCSLCLVDGALEGLRAHLLSELAESLQIPVLAFGASVEPIPRLSMRQLPVLVKPHAAIFRSQAY